MNKAVIIEDKKKAHISKEKKKEVSELEKLFSEYNTIALVNLESLPSHQLQVMRKKIGDYAIIRVTKKRLIKKALENIKEKKDVKDFDRYLERVMPAIIFSKENAFKLASLLRKNKSQVAAKPGQIAPKDLVVNAGPTPFTPGPIIGELGSMGVKAAVEEGKIVVKEDTVVVKEGEEINAQVADLLAKLDIKPMEIGLNLVAAYESGLILDRDVLEFDEELYVGEIKKIASDAFKLTIGVGYVTKDNVIILLNKAENEVKALANAAGVITPDGVKALVGKANKEAENLLGKVKVKEEPSPGKEVHEEKKKEAKTEDLKKNIDEKKEKGKDIKEEKMNTTILDDKPVEEEKKEEVPTAEELAERKKQKEKGTEGKSSTEEEIPSLQELAEKPKKEENEVPSAYDLAEKKKNNTDTEDK